MSVEDRDPTLQAIFAEAAQAELIDDNFTNDIMQRLRRRQYQWWGAAAGVLVTLLALAWGLALPLQAFGLLVVQVFSTTLIDMGSGWLAFVCSPVNNLASLLLLSFRIMRSGWNWINRASYVN